MTLIGNRPEWVLAMVACFRLGAVVLPCTEQLRSKDLRLRLDVAAPAAVLADARDLDQLQEAGPDCPVIEVPDETLFDAEPAPAAELAPEDPCLITFTSGTAGAAQGRAPRPALPLRAARPGRALARARARRPRVVHGRERLVEVGAQRVHRALAARRRRAAARRALRPARAARAPRPRAGQRAVHGARPSTG